MWIRYRLMVTWSITPTPTNNKTTPTPALACRRRILLSGTPLQNDLNEFYAMVRPPRPPPRLACPLYVKPFHPRANLTPC